MNYWFFIDQSGNIYPQSATVYPDDSLTPTGYIMLGPFSSLDESQESAFSSPQAYLYQNGEFVSNPNYSSFQLNESIAAQIASINAGYAITMNAGFASNATGTSATYASDSATLQEIGWVRTMPEASFPSDGIPAKLQSGTYSAPLTYAQMNQLATDAQTWYLAQKGQLVSLLNQVNVQQSPPSTPVAWSPGAYTPQPAPSN